MTLDQLITLPHEQQMDAYQQIYVLYLAAEDIGDASAVEEFETQLWLIKKYCALSAVDTALCEAPVALSRAQEKALVDSVESEVQEITKKNTVH